VVAHCCIILRGLSGDYSSSLSAHRSVEHSIEARNLIAKQAAVNAVAKMHDVEV